MAALGDLKMQFWVTGEMTGGREPPETWSRGQQEVTGGFGAEEEQGQMWVCLRLPSGPRGPEAKRLGSRKAEAQAIRGGAF